MGYSNEVFYDFENISSDTDCLAETVESSFKIEQSSKEFFDIIVEKSTTHYSRGCIEKEIKEEQVVFKFDSQKYLSK